MKDLSEVQVHISTYVLVLNCLQNSNRIICSAVFGFDDKLAVRPSLRFNQNNLVISSVDIQSVEPVDQRTRDSLQKSVQLAIEITTNSQEAAARSDKTLTYTHTHIHTRPDHFCRLMGSKRKFNTSINMRGGLYGICSALQRQNY